MKKLAKKLLWIGCLLCVSAGCAFGLTACKDDEESSSPQTVIELTLAQEKVELVLGDGYTVRATVEGSEEAVAFATSDPTVASVDQNGVVTTLKAGTATITATVAGVSQSCVITVVDGGFLPYITLEGVGTTEDFNLLVGDEFAIDGATYFRGNKVNEALAVTSDKPEVVKVENGKLVAVASGTATITVTSEHLGMDAVKIFEVSVVRNIEIDVSVNRLTLFTQPLFGGIAEYTVQATLKEDGEALTGVDYVVSVKDTQVADMAGDIVVALGVGETAIVISCTVEGVEYTREIALTVKNPRLAEVETFEIVNGKLVWDEVEGADYYVVSDVDNEWEVQEESFDCSDFLGEKTFFITAHSNLDYVESSDDVQFTYVFQTRAITEKILATESMEASISPVSEANAITDGAIYFVDVSKSTLGGSEGDMVVKKIYHTTTAYKHYGAVAGGWCHNSIFDMNEAIAKYMGYQFTFWAYAEEEITFKIAYLKDGNWGRGSSATQTVPAKTWTKVSLTFSDGSFPYLTWLSATGDFYACDFRISDPEYDAVDYSSLSWFTDRVQTLLNTLPANAAEATIFDGARISEIEKYHALLSDTEKAKLTGMEKIQPIKASIEENFCILADMSGTSGLVANTVNYGTSATLSNGFDATVGNYLNVYYKKGTQLALNYQGISELASKLADCNYVYFSVYNGASRDKKLFCNFGGSLLTNYASLQAGAWTTVSVPVEDFLAPTKSASGVAYFGVLDAETNVNYKISMIYATKTSYVPPFDGVVADMSSTNGFSLNGTYVTSGTLTTGVDQTYGNYLQVNYVKGSQCVINYAFADLAAKLEDYDRVEFYVYNGLEANKWALVDFGGAQNTKWTDLKAGDWTKVSATVADFISGSYFGVYSGENAGTFKFSAIVAVKNEAAPANELALADMKTTSSFTENASGCALAGLVWGYDAAYGYNLAVARKFVSGRNTTNLLVNYNFAGLASAVEGYDTVYFYVYNPFAEAKQFYSNFGGTATAGVTLAAGAWTRVEVSAADFVKGTYMGVTGASTLDTYAYVRFSAFTAVKNA